MKKKLSFLSFFISIICLGQTIPNLEGEYYFEHEKAKLYIFNKNEFLVLGYYTAVNGKIEVVDNILEFKPKYASSKTFLYGRESAQRQIIINEKIFGNSIYYTERYNNENDIPLRKINKCDDYCRSNFNYLPIEKKTNELIFKSINERNYVTCFKINKDYNEFLLKYIPKDTEIFFLPGAFKIKDNQLFFSNAIQRKDLTITEGIRNLIETRNLVVSTLEDDKIYLDEDLKVVFGEIIDLSQYTFNELKNQYIKKIPSERLNILYVYTKIESELKFDDNYKVDSINLAQTKCLKTPKTILEEEEDEKREYENEPAMIIDTAN